MNYRTNDIIGRLLIRPGVVITLLLAVSVAWAAPPAGHVSRSLALNAEDYDLRTYIDINNILCFVTNTGSLAMDQTGLFGRPNGWYYPYTGDTADITSGAENRTLMYAAGLVLAGKVNHEIRTAVAAYDNTEFVPGPLATAEPPPEPAFFRVFKLDRHSGPGDPDYDEWPAEYGAPVDTSGLPLVIGDQVLWTVFNDADSSVHNNYYGGGTQPLGVEVRLTTWGELNEEEENVISLQYELYNRGDNVIDSFYLSFWADPDLGGPNDDLVGCDTINDLFFVYNGDDDDAYYDDITPAWGGKLVSGPVIPSPGDTAVFGGRSLLDHKNLGMTAFTRYINGSEPDSPEKLFRYLQGWDAECDQPYLDPMSDDTVHYYAPGDAVARTGWVDRANWDQRVLVSCGPLTFMPGDSQQVMIRLGAYAETDRIFSLSVLRHLLDESIPIDSTPDTIKYVAVDSARVDVTDFGLNRVFFDPVKEQWLTGITWGGHYFNGGVDYASEFLGSLYDPVVDANAFCAVEIRFSNILTQKAYRYVRDETSTYAYGGYYDVPFTVWDISRGRQLNAAFVEWLGSGVVDSAWGPDTPVNLGGREFLLIFDSEYSGTDPTNSDLQYVDINLFDKADSLDLLYFCWTAVSSPLGMGALEEGHRLVFDGQFLNPNGPVDTLWFRPTEIGGQVQQVIEVSSFGDGPTRLDISATDPTAFVPTSDYLQYVDLVTQRIALAFAPYRSGYYDEQLIVSDASTGEILRRIQLIGRTPDVTGVEEEPGILPRDFSLGPNYPNPFNPSTIIEYTLARRSRVAITVYNMLGREVTTLVDAFKPAGRYTVAWDGTAAGGRSVASGMYFYRMVTASGSETRKMLLLR